MVAVTLVGLGFGLAVPFGASAIPGARGAARPDIPADGGSPYTVSDLGTPPYYPHLGPYGDGYSPTGVTVAGAVLFPLAGLLVNGAYEQPSNEDVPAPNDASDSLDGAMEMFDVNDSDLVVGAIQHNSPGGPMSAAIWQAGPSTEYKLIDFSGMTPAGSSVATSIAHNVDNTGHISGSVTFKSGSAGHEVGFVMSSPTAQPVAAPLPGGGDSTSVLDINWPWELLQNSGATDVRYNTSTKQADAVTGDVLSANGTVDGIGSLVRADNATVQLSGPQPHSFSIADNDSSAGYIHTADDKYDAAAWDAAGTYTDLDTLTGLTLGLSPGPATASNGSLADYASDGHAYLLTVAGNPPPVVNSTGDAPAVTAGSQGCTTGKTVTVNGASAPECTLRAAIQAENAGSVTQKTISFALPSGAGAIAPGTPLPALKAVGVTVDGTSGPGGLVVVNATALDQGQAVLHVSGGSDTVAGVVPELATIGVLVDAKAGHDVVRGCSIGVASPTSSSNTQISVGVKVLNSPSVTIGGVTAADANVISSVGVGVFVDGAASRGAVVQGNYVGSDAAGDSEPDSSGVVLLDASGARIGGPSSTPGAAPGNVFDGYTSGTVSQDGSAAVGVTGVTGTVSGTQVQGNLIGLDPDGSTAAPHHFKYGVLVGGRTSGTVIGGTGAGQGNVISGASDAQVTISGTFTSGTQVLGNLLGTDASGMHVIGGSGGVQVDAASSTTIGTAGSGRNVIAGQQIGVATSATSTPVTVGSALGGDGTTPLPGTNNVTTKSAMSTIVSGDIIGPLADGSSVDAEHVMHTGVALAGTGETVGPNNQIAFTDTAVNVAGSSETVYGNLIGTTPDGTNPLPNGVGVFVAAGTGVKSTSSTGVPTVRIGLPGQKANVISGNTDDLFAPSPALVRNNLIGTVANGLSAMPAYSGPALPDTIAYGAGYGGVLALVGGAGSVIGGTQPGSGNVISGGPPAAGSVQATGALAISASHVTVQGNDIGVGSDGTTAVPNAGYGIRVTSGGNDVIGAPTPGGHGTTTTAGGNVIANNGGGGVVVAKDVAGVSILSNQIHDNTGAGINLLDESSNNGISAPSITAAAQDAANTGAPTDHTIVIGRATAPSQPVQIYAAANCAADGSPGQGAAVLATALTDKHGDFSIAVPIQPVGSQLDATYTDTRGTSTFSGCEAVAPAANGTVTQPTGKPGDPDTADGDGFTPGEPVQGSVHSTPVALGTHTADSNGDVSFTFHIPAGIEAGQHYVLLTGQTSGNTVAIPLTVHTAPSPPRTVHAQAGKHRVTLSWAAPADTGGQPVTGYRIQRSAGHAYSTLHTLTGHTRTYTDHTVTGGHTYHYRIQAINSIGASSASNTATATPYTPPSAPRAVQATTGHDSITVTWNAPAHNNGAPIIGYRAQYATCTLGAHGCHPHAVTVHTRHVLIKHLHPAHTYHLRVTALNRAGAGDPSKPTTAKPKN